MIMKKERFYYKNCLGNGEFQLDKNPNKGRINICILGWFPFHFFP